MVAKTSFERINDLFSHMGLLPKGEDKMASSGLRIKGSHAAIELGGDVKLLRTGPGMLQIDASVMAKTVDVSAENLYIEGVPLRRYIKNMLAKAVDSYMPDDKHDDDMGDSGSFDYKVSLVYQPGTDCTVPDEYMYIPEQVLTRPIGECTKNVINSTVVFECDGNGVILEHVYWDALSGYGTTDCSGDIVHTMPISNGCSEYDWGAMHMEWDGSAFCGRGDMDGDDKDDDDMGDSGSFDYKVSLVYQPGTDCTVPDEYMYIPEQVLT